MSVRHSVVTTLYPGLVTGPIYVLEDLLTMDVMFIIEFNKENTCLLSVTNGGVKYKFDICYWQHYCAQDLEYIVNTIITAKRVGCCILIRQTGKSDDEDSRSMAIEQALQIFMDGEFCKYMDYGEHELLAACLSRETRQQLTQYHNSVHEGGRNHD